MEEVLADREDVANAGPRSSRNDRRPDLVVTLEVFKLYIIDKNAGICVFDQTFQEMPRLKCTDLVAGFLHALQLFAEDMASQSIKNIELSGMLLTLYSNKKILCAIATGTRLLAKDRRFIREFLERVTSRFERDYQLFLDSGNISNTGVFKGFAAVVEEELEQKSMDVTYIEAPVEHFKQHYENATNDLQRFKNSLLQDYNSLTTPVARSLRGHLDESKYIAGQLFKFTTGHSRATDGRKKVDESHSP